MDIFKPLVTAFFLILTSFNLQAVELKGADGKYRYHDQKVRTELLGIAQALYANDMHDKALHLYRVLAKKFQSAQQRPDQREACKAVLNILTGTKRLDEWPKHMAGCALSEREDLFFESGAALMNAQAASNYFLYLVNNSEQFSGDSTKNRACTHLGTLIAKYPKQKFPPELHQSCKPSTLRTGEMRYAASFIPTRQLISLHLQSFYRKGIYDDDLDLETPLNASLQRFQSLIQKWSQTEQEAEKDQACGIQTQILHWANRFEENSPWLAGCSQKSVYQGINDFASEFSFWHIGVFRRTLPSEERLALKLYNKYIPKFLQEDYLAIRDSACVNLAREQDVRNSKTDLSSICTPSQIRRGKILRAETHEYVHEYREAQRQYVRFINEWKTPDARDERLIACQLLKWQNVKMVKQNTAHLLNGCEKNLLVDSYDDPKLLPVVAHYIANSHYRKKLIAEHRHYQKQWEGVMTVRNAAVPRISPALNSWGDSAQFEFDVSKWGKVSKIRTTDHADQIGAERAIKSVLRDWRFAPTLVDGKPVAVKNLRVWLGFQDDAVLRFSELNY